MLYYASYPERTRIYERLNMRPNPSVERDAPPIGVAPLTFTLASPSVKGTTPTSPTRHVPVAVLAASDAARYKALMLHAYEHAADAFTSTPQERAQEPDEWWIRRVADPEEMTVAFGYFVGTSLVGTVALEFSAKPKTQHKALVVAMYVLPSYRGAGSARALLQAAVAFCKDRGDICIVQLEVTEGNTPALSLYESLGFQSYGVEPMAVLTPNGFKSKVHMWLDLSSTANAG